MWIIVRHSKTDKDMLIIFIIWCDTVLQPGCYLNIQMCLNPMFCMQNHNLEILNNNFTNNKLSEGTDFKHTEMTQSSF